MFVPQPTWLLLVNGLICKLNFGTLYAISVDQPVINLNLIFTINI